ncbi:MULTISPECIES: response regulator [unclassified Mesorhizobium]|jgi:CheY-like chemotaxis protein|uniref:response regulator n=1 Tax=unclassified Mesorhizobium TaxID=325217 RepID=UPI000FE3792D|nr:MULTISPECIES: response regulator [unclassified Mesorhizobium]MDG4894038.1 response regulator [Mesorhizobium sp. WSM4976]RWH70813.1 MAG: response regulator [Mesorhizobium sp.]RWL21479.1 MAG: response regulator [Mesorhizobium sp.]RWL31786.1 MAG: response regulator [Mesorhizobium sp.]RWL38610.1 MAG: response regulator [Mesorhizobium sp.]
MTEPLNVLIVEDEALLAMELESLIEEAGHSVVGWAMSSDEAKAMVDTSKADIAFVDVHLSDGPTGLDVAEHIQRSGQPMVVFMTANPKRIPENFVGAVGVIAKPYTMNGVRSALRYLQEGVRRPPPVSVLPAGFTLAPDFLAVWAPSIP